MRRWGGFGVLLGWITASSLAFADPGSATKAIAEVRTHFEELDFELAIDAADRALGEVGLMRSQRIEALRIKGSALVVLGRNDDAVAAFERIFAIDPDFELPDGTSPRILGVFRPARAAWQVRMEERLATELGAALAALQLDVRLPPSPRGGRPFAVVVELADPHGLAKDILVAYRRGGELRYSTLVAAAKSGTIELSIPGAFTASERSYWLELHVRARHRSGGILRRAGAADAPLRAHIAAGRVPKGTRVTKRWWFWAGAATLAASAVVIPLLVDRATDVGPQRIRLGFGGALP